MEFTAASLRFDDERSDDRKREEEDIDDGESHSLVLIPIPFGFCM